LSWDIQEVACAAMAFQQRRFPTYHLRQSVTHLLNYFISANTSKKGFITRTASID